MEIRFAMILLMREIQSGSSFRVFYRIQEQITKNQSHSKGFIYAEEFHP